MKQTHTIQITIDTDAKAGTSRNVKYANDPTHYVEIVPPKDGSKLEDTLAHELGHVIGEIFKTPAHEGDPRLGHGSEIYDLYAMFGVPEDHGRRMFESESEAWEFAKRMRKIDKKAIEYSLGSYWKAWKGE